MIIDRPQLVGALKRAKQVRSRRTSIEILSTCRIDTTAEAATITATDMETTLRVTLRPEANPSRIDGLMGIDRALDALNAMTCERVWLDQVEEGHILICNADRMLTGTIHEVPGSELPVGDYPKLPPLLDVEVACAVGGRDLAEAFHGVDKAASRDESRPVMNMVELRVDRALRFAATDSYRLHVVPVRGEPMMPGTMLVPAKALRMVCKAVARSEATVAIEKLGKFVRLAVEDGDSWITYPAEGQYPQVDKLWPDRVGRQWANLQARTLLQAIRQVEAAKETKTDPVVISLFRDGTGSLQDPPGRCVMPLIVGSTSRLDDVDLGVNAQYLREAVEAVGTEQVELTWENALKPMTIGWGDDDAACLVMPVRLSAFTVVHHKEPEPEPEPKPESKPAPEVPARDKPSNRLLIEGRAYANTLMGARREYADAYLRYLLGQRKTRPKETGLPPRQAANTRDRLKAIAERVNHS